MVNDDDIPSWVTHFHMNRNYYLHKPIELSTFIQNKIEYGDMIINIGMRYDYFDANSWIPTNPHEPYIQNPRDPQLDSLSLDERLNINWGDISYFDIDSETQDTSWYSYSEYGNYIYNEFSKLSNKTGWFTKTTPKSQWSPRFGIAYPISDKAVIHFSYGFFFKFHNLSYYIKTQDTKSVISLESMVYLETPI